VTNTTAPIGVLLIQLGTPDSTSVRDVRRYLREFLSDPRVIDLSAPARALLLNTIILPFRPRRSAKAYRKIWTENGSPLIIHTEALASKIQELLGDGYRVTYGMRYRNPLLAEALDDLLEAGCTQIVGVPLFPQYASASTGSAIEALLEEIGRRTNIPGIATINWFYDHPGFVDSLADIARPALQAFQPDHVLFSFHGLPESQIRKADPSGTWCLREPGCCDCILDTNRYCYRAQSFATTRALATALCLDEGTFSTTFQSRLVGQRWIEPYTDKRLPELFNDGVRRLAVLTPSFTADCLETIEEIGIRGRTQWEQLGGEDMLLIPCVNADPGWAVALGQMIRGAI